MMQSKACIHFIIMLLLLGIQDLIAQRQYRSTLLKETADMIAERGGSLDSGYHELAGLRGGYEIRMDDTQKIVHIGTPLFSRIIEKEYPSLLYDFAERYLLWQYLLPVQERMYRLHDDKVMVDPDLLDKVDSLITNIQLVTEDNRGGIIWTLPDSTYYSFSFPQNFQLLYGLNKIEAEREFIDELEKLAAIDIDIVPAEVDSSEVIKEEPYDIYVKSGGSTFIDEIRGDTYYHKDTIGALFPLDSELFPNETLANYCHCLVGNGLNLHVKQRLYGNEKCYYTVPLQTIASLFLQQGCKAYVGFEHAPADRLQASVFYVNEDMSYDHLLFIDVDIDMLKRQEGEAEAEVIVFTPTHNLKSLFAPNELQKNEK